MSRLGFRHAVTLPRPRSAVFMVALATLTLAITEQVELWVLALTLFPLGWAFVRGDRPAPWQTMGPLLNAGLALSVLIGFSFWWNGQLTLLALAHFAMLAQGLQLVDARPRKSEFLLVALAVFQVTMAANLTDSAFFPPLLIAFTVATVWTLIIHTLRAEAIEAGEPAAAQRVLSRGLMRTTLIASLVSVLLSAALFPILPRIRSGAIFDKGFGAPLSVSGFSDNVELGDIGRIRKDTSVVLRVETTEGPVLSPEKRYWRGLAFDHFDGRRWSITPTERNRIQGDPEIGIDLGGSRTGVRVVQQITREQVSPGVLFSPGSPAGFRGGVGRLDRDVNGSLIAHATAGKRILYHMAFHVAPRDFAALRIDSTVLPEPSGERFLQLPEFSAGVSQLASDITAASATDIDRAIALEDWLQSEGRYTDSPPDFGSDASPVEGFLLRQTEGHCEYFASSMVVLARSLGMPARIVNGFASGHENSLGGFLQVAQSDAHTWVEVHFAEAGWVRFDPTPADLRMAGSDALRAGRTWADLASAVELWWFTNVVDYDRGHQARAMRSLWYSWQEWRKERGQTQVTNPSDEEKGWSLPVPSGALWGFGIVALLVFMAAADFRRRKRRAVLPVYYAKALRGLRRHGFERDDAESARAFASTVAAEVSAAAGQAFHRITEAYLGERFGEADAPDLDEELRTLRDSLRA
jgi:transglutaminase-like putative cysteine protease